MRYVKFKWVAKVIVFGIAFITLFTTAAMLLWNNLAVDIFGLPALGFFQTLGLIILARLFTGNLGGRGWGGMRGRHMRERWRNMSESERQTFMERWNKRGCGPRSTEPDPSADTTTTV